MTSNRQPVHLVFGTSADPIHEGHVQLVSGAVKELLKRGFWVEQVILVPVYRHHTIHDAVKQSLPLTYEHRFDLCVLAAREIEANLKQDNVRVSVSRIEETLVSKSNRPNFTAETLAAMRSALDSKVRLAFLIGADSFSGQDPSFEHWFASEKVVNAAMLVISPRQGFVPNWEYLQTLQERGAELIYLSGLIIPDVSSREIRSRLAAQENPEDLVREGLISQETSAYIRTNHLIALWKTLDSQQGQTVVVEAPHEGDDLETKIGKILYQKKLTISLAESCTGGLIGHRLTNVPGASEYFMGAIVSYSYQSKVNQLGVRWETLKRYGAVSAETVREMAFGAATAFNTDIALSVSCIAGPGGATSSKPLGTCWCAVAAGKTCQEFHFLLEGNRLQVKEQLAQKALEKLYKIIQDLPA